MGFATSAHPVLEKTEQLYNSFEDIRKWLWLKMMVTAFGSPGHIDLDSWATANIADYGDWGTYWAGGDSGQEYDPAEVVVQYKGILFVLDTMITRANIRVTPPINEGDGKLNSYWQVYYDPNKYCHFDPTAGETIGGDFEYRKIVTIDAGDTVWTTKCHYFLPPTLDPHKILRPICDNGSCVDRFNFIELTRKVITGNIHSDFENVWAAASGEAFTQFNIVGGDPQPGSDNYEPKIYAPYQDAVMAAIERAGDVYKLEVDQSFIDMWEIFEGAYDADVNVNDPIYFEMGGIGSVYWQCNGSAFELALKKISSFDWYWDEKHSYLPKWLDAMNDGGDWDGHPIYPIGCWRRTWKYSMGRPRPDGELGYDYVWRPDYGQANVDDICLYNCNVWACITQHEVGTTFDTTKWRHYAPMQVGSKTPPVKVGVDNDTEKICISQADWDNWFAGGKPYAAHADKVIAVDLDYIHDESNYQTGADVTNLAIRHDPIAREQVGNNEWTAYERCVEIINDMWSALGQQTLINGLSYYNLVTGAWGQSAADHPDFTPGNCGTCASETVGGADACGKSYCNDAPINGGVGNGYTSRVNRYCNFANWPEEPRTKFDAGFHNKGAPKITITKSGTPGPHYTNTGGAMLRIAYRGIGVGDDHDDRTSCTIGFMGITINAPVEQDWWEYKHIGLENVSNGVYEARLLSGWPSIGSIDERPPGSCDGPEKQCMTVEYQERHRQTAINLSISPPDRFVLEIDWDTFTGAIWDEDCSNCEAV